MKKFVLITLSTLLAGGTLSTNVRALSDQENVTARMSKDTILEDDSQKNEIVEKDLEEEKNEEELNEEPVSFASESEEIENRFELLSDDLKKLYWIKNEDDPFTKEEYLDYMALDMYSQNIWSFEPEGEVFIVKDFTGVDQFTNLQSMTIAFVGDISEYNFEDISKLENIDISLNYEPRIVSDHATGGPGMRYKYMYSKEHEDGIINYLEEFAKHITQGNDVNITVGVGMSTIPRMYRYDWMVEYLNKDVNVSFMQQDSNNIYHVLDYEVIYDTSKKTYYLSYDMENPFSGFKYNGTEFVRTPGTLGKLTYFDDGGYESLSFFTSESEEIKIVEDGLYVADEYEFENITRIKGDMRMDYLVDHYYDDGKPGQQGPTTELPTRITHMSLADMLFKDDIYVHLNISFAIYVELPSLINFESDISESIFLEEDLLQYRRDKEKLKSPEIVNQPMNYVFEGWYTTPTFDEGTEWDFENDLVETNAYVYEDPFKRSATVQTPENLYAKWTPRSEFVTVDFVSNNDQVIDEQLIKKGNVVSEPTLQDYDGYTFLGWYSDADFKTEWNFSTTVNTDMTLYAKWEQITYTVTFDSKGGTSVDPIIDVLPNNTITAPANPTKDGNEFVQWEKDGIVWNFETDQVTGDMTLDAVWKLKEDVLNPEEPKEPDKPTAKEPNKTDSKDVETGINQQSLVLLISILAMGILFLFKTRKRKEI